MASRELTATEEMFNDYVDRAGWSSRKQREILLGFIDSIGADEDLAEYVESVLDDDDVDQAEPFDTEDE